MNLICPNCGSSRINYAGMSLEGGGYGSTDQKYWCEDCKYHGSLIVDRVSQDYETGDQRYREIPTGWVLILGMISGVAIALNGIFTDAVVFFAVFSSILIIVFHFIGREEESVEDDLRNLDENGNPIARPYRS